MARNNVMTPDEEERLRQQQQQEAEAEARRQQAEAQRATEEAARKAQEQGLRRTMQEQIKGVEYKTVEHGRIDLPEGMEKAEEHLNKANEAGELKVGQSTFGGTNRIQVDYGSIQDNEQAAYFAMAVPEEDRKQYFAEYAKASGQNLEDVLAYADDKLGANLFAAPQSNAGKRKAAMSALSGMDLFDIAGEDIDVNTADFDVVVQSLSNIADKGRREEAASYVESLTKIPGSPFYGRTFDKDDIEYRDSADLPESVYKEEVENLSGQFYVGDSAFDTNRETYLALFEGLMDSYGDNPYAMRQMESALQAAYEKQTGYVAPKSADVIAALDAIAEYEKSTQDPDLQNLSFGDKIKRVLSSGSDFLSGVFGGKKKAASGSTSASTYAAAGSTSSAETEVAPAEQESASYDFDVLGVVDENTPRIPTGEVHGPVYRPGAGASETHPDFDVLGVINDDTPRKPTGEVQGPAWMPWLANSNQPAQKAEEEAPQAPMSAGEALKTYLLGKDLSEENYAQIKQIVENDTFRRVVLNRHTPTPQQILQETHENGHLLSSAERHVRANSVTSGYQLLGKSLGAAADLLSSGALPDDIALEGTMLLGDIISRADRLVRSGQVHLPKGVNKYDYVLSQSSALQKKAEQLGSLQAEVERIKAAEAEEAEKQRQQDILSAEIAYLSGNATREQEMLLTERAMTFDLHDEPTRRQLRFMVDVERSPYYMENGSFWRGKSAAGQTGARLKETDPNKFRAFQNQLAATARNIIDELTYNAYDHGFTLESYLKGANIGIEQIMEMAYNRINGEGKELIENPEIVQEVSELTDAVLTKKVGLGTAFMMGAESGYKETAASFAYAPYQAGSLMTYEDRRNRIYSEYDQKYGPLAAKKYRQDLIDYAKSGNLSAETSKALLDDVDKAVNIFDIAYDIDPGWLESSYREAMEHLSKDIEALESAAALMPEYERAVYYGNKSFTSNVAMQGGALAMSLPLTAVGAPALLTRAVSMTAYTFPAITRAYKDNLNAGLNENTAMMMAVAEGAGIGLINSLGDQAITGMIFGDALARSAIEQTLRQPGAGKYSVLRAAARDLTKIGKHEAKEEIAEVFFSQGVDYFIPVAAQLEKGVDLKPSEATALVWNEVKETDVKKLWKDVVMNGLAGFAYGALFASAGVAMDGYRSVRNVKMQKQFASVDIASQIVHGEIPANEENLGRFIDAMRSDSKNPEYRDAMDTKSASAAQVENVAIAAMGGTGKEARLAALTETRKADEYDKKARAATQAADTNRSQFYIARQEAANGNVGASKTLEGFRVAWAKAQTTVEECTVAAGKAREKAAEYTAQWLRECSAVARVIDKSTKMSASVQMINMMHSVEEARREPEWQEQADNTAAMEAEAAIEELHPNASEEQKNHLREVYGVPVNTGTNAAAAAVEAEAAPAAQPTSESDTQTQPQAGVEAAPAAPAAQNVSPVATQSGPVMMAQDSSTQQESQPVASEVTQEAQITPVADMQTVQEAQPAAAEAAADTMPRSSTHEERMRLKAAADIENFASQVSKRFGVKVNIVDPNHHLLRGKANGAYVRSEGAVYISRNASQGDVLRQTMVHELTHRAEKAGNYNELADALLAAHWKGDENAMNARLNNIRSRYSKFTGKDFSPEAARKELVAEAAEALIGGDQEMVNRLVAERPSVARRIADAIKDFLKRITGVKSKEVDQLSELEKMLRKALDDRKVRQMQEAAHPDAVQFSVESLAEAVGLGVRVNEDGVPYTLVDKDGNEVTEITTEMIAKTPMGNLINAARIVGTIDEKTANAQMEMFAGLATLAAQYKDQAMVWEIAGAQLFSAIKSNSDKQYGTTVDFGTICAKTQAVVDVMSDTMLELGRGLTRAEVLDAYRATAGVGYDVPCPVCYVFSRWMGVPSLLGNMASYQERFSGMSEQQVRDYVNDVESRYADGDSKPSSAIAKKKTKIEGKLARIEKKMLKNAAEGKDNSALDKQAQPLVDELNYIEAYNWVTQVLCKKNVRDENGQVVLDPDYEPVPADILFDLNRTGDFAKYKKSWTYRTTRGAGMGKSILPYSGAKIGDTVKGTKDRWSDLQNAFLTGDEKAAQQAIKNAVRRQRAQNLIGGQRFQSTSDYRPEWGIDYMMTFLEMQAIGAKGQLYTKVIEAVDMFASAGIETNLSIMGRGDGYHLENGKPVLGVEDFSDVTGISFEQALEKTKQYDNVQMILVGLNDTHIRLALADDRITFVIPWHSSGNSGETLAKLMDSVGEQLNESSDYTKSQSDKPNSKATAKQKAAMDLRMRILTGALWDTGLSEADQKILDGNKYLADLYNRFYVDESAVETYGVELSASQAGQVFPYEYWDTSLRIEQADENGRRFREYCESIGLKPRFPQFANDPGYWKLLIDRRMYNRDGTYHHPKPIDVTGVKVGDVAQSVGKVKYGDSARTQQAVAETLDMIRSRIPSERYNEDVDIGDGGARMDDVSFSLSEPYTLPSDEDLRAEFDAWREARNAAEPAQLALSDGESQIEESAQSVKGDRQTATQTIQQNEFIPDWVKQDFMNDLNKREYDVESNQQQLQRAWSRIQRDGYDGTRDRLAGQTTKFTTEDNADALVMMSMALHDGDLDTFMAVATKYNEEGTEQGKALQIRSMLRKMTPTGFVQMAVQSANRKLEQHMKTHAGESKHIERQSREIEEDTQLRNEDSTSTSERIASGEDVIIDTRESYQGVMLNGQQKALIERFKLGKVKRNLANYNWATLKQRMLEEIIASPNAFEKDSNGFDLTERLLRMQKGQPIFTKMDAAYEAEQMGIFNALADKNSREADLALARAHEAQGNVEGVTFRQQARTWRYVSMLLSVPSALRNVTGNLTQNLLNAAADGIAVELDKAVSKVTGERKRSHISLKDRVDGLHAFVTETKNTYRDFFKDKAITQRGEDRYNHSQRGRVYQNSLMEAMRHIEGFLMSVGDRNFWRKKFLNSMAEQQRLADLNGTEFDVEAAMEIAEAEANYATFTEDSAVRELFAMAKNIPVVGDILDFIVPFTGVPTNIVKRMWQFSPAGLASSAIIHGYRGIRGRTFDQRAFVDSMARGLTGTTMFAIGMALRSAGAIKLGTGDEEDDKSYGVRTAMGDQYTPYIRVFGKYYSLSTFAPSASAMVMGATASDLFKDDIGAWQAIYQSCLSGLDQIFDASYMSSLKEIFQGYGSTAENIGTAVINSAVSQNVPAILGQIASSMDDYVRDTKDKNAIMEALNYGLISKIPIWRKTLPEKVDVAGRSVENTKQGLAAFIDPFTTSYAVDDPALAEILRLRDELTKLGVDSPRAHMPSDAVSGRKNTLTQNKQTVTLSPEDKEAFRKRYGELWREGGKTYTKKGKRKTIEGVSDLIASRKYQLADDEEKAAMIEDIVAAAREGAIYEFIHK